MKVASALLFLALLAVPAYALDTDEWYAYNGAAATHTFSVQFPNDWQIKEISSQEHTFSPAEAETPSITLQEFPHFTIEDLIKYYRTDENSFLSRKDRILATDSQDLVMRELDFSNFRVLALQRGTSMIVLKENDPQYSEIFEAILPTINFSDQWHQYIDFSDQYTFSFPRSLKLITINNGVKLTKNDRTVFLVRDGEIVENTAAETEINDSFYFFDIGETARISHLFFPDVDNAHPNATAINSLTQDKVISGYPDGTFQPDGLINRAELTKMIIATKTAPDKSKYQNCFSDVQKQWFAPYICYAKANNWVSGYADGRFGPENFITRVEALKIVLEAMTTESFEAGEPLWYTNYLDFSNEHELLELDGLSPTDEISRKEVAELIYRIDQQL